MRYTLNTILLFAISAVIALHGATPSYLSGSVSDDLTSVKTLVEVDQNGSFTQTTVKNRFGSISFNQSNGSVTLSPPNVQWIIDDGGLFYIPTKVALGARGNQAFYGCYLNNERTRLFSTTTTLSSNAPVWDDGGLYEAWSDIYVDASDDGNVLAAIAQFAIGGDPTKREVVLFKYMSDSSTPDWTYTFPDTINAGARIKVSKDGTFIASALTDEEAGILKISYFSSASPTPLFTDSFSAGYIRALDMTDDGSLLYINEGTMVHIYETATQSIIYSVDAMASFDSHTISGDGNRFAFGGFNFVKCYQWNGTTYEYQFQYYKAGMVYCARCDLSGDAGILAATFITTGQVWNSGSNRSTRRLAQ